VISSIAGKTVVITGASRGIGLGIAQAFSEAGARLHLVANDEAVIDRAAAMGATGAVCDIVEKAQVIAALSGVGPIDTLINNAGLELFTAVNDDSEQTTANFRRIIEINVIGTSLVTTQALKAMAAGASIINTASIWGRTAEAGFGAYVASKHAVIGLTKTWAKELGPRNIRVNAVCPGWVRTEASMRSLARMSHDQNVQENVLLDRIVGAQALPGLMNPPDVAGAYLFLASDLARNMTGQSIGVDRGEVPW
jgi:3-hydroxybutyrate dehydrogenase